jgi:hypothetical protein
MSFARYKASLDVQIHQGKPEGVVWFDYPRFEVPSYVLDYSGQSPAHILLVLYKRAESYELSDRISLKVREDTVAEETGLKPRTVRYAFARLEADRRIRRVRTKRSDGRFLASRVELLDGEGQTLSTAPRRDNGVEYGVCSHNQLPFITVPKECLDAINEMKLASQKSVYFSALSLVSQDKQESVYVQKDKWQELSGLDRNAFNSGVAYCKREKLLRYSGEVLSVFDPVERAPNVRWKNPKPRIDHGPDTKWKFRFASVPAEVWRMEIEKLLGHGIEIGKDGWSLRYDCPFCHDHKPRFHVNFEKTRYTCHLCKRRGRLGELISDVDQIPMSVVIARLKRSMETPEAISVEPPEVISV